MRRGLAEVNGKEKENDEGGEMWRDVERVRGRCVDGPLWEMRPNSLRPRKIPGAQSD